MMAENSEQQLYIKSPEAGGKAGNSCLVSSELMLLPDSNWPLIYNNDEAQ